MSASHTVLRPDGATLSYRTLGASEGPAVLLLHGWMMSSAVWDVWLPQLDVGGRRLIIPDMRGCGGSSRWSGEYSHAQLAADALACLDAEGVAQARVVGHSMGGQLAQWIAAHHPARVSALTLLTPVPARGMSLPPEADGLFSTSGGDRGKQGTILDLACRQLGEATREAMLDDAGQVPASMVEAIYRLWSQASFEEALGQVEAPTLVVATDDPFLPPAFLRQAVVERIARARLVYLPGPGHYPQAEQPGATAALVESFWAGLELGSGSAS